MSPVDAVSDRAEGPDRSAPIGVFDSGVGGLTVLQAIRERLPRESTVYLGDTARVPYGPKSPETVRRYAAEAASFLVDRGVKLLVVACNTASARALPDFEASLPVPVVGVVGPGAREAAERSTGGRIGVLGTRGTIESGAYQRAIRALRTNAYVEGVACPLFVALVEEGWTTGEVARLTARHYLEPVLASDVDTLVLGCTHYPHLRELLAEVTGGRVALVEPARATAEEVAARLAELHLAADGAEAPEHRYYVTDGAERFRELASRWMGEEIEHLEEVSLGAVGGAPQGSQRSSETSSGVTTP